ncbi:hypothetical protein INT47_004025 [Mucor saturninus]|uniref:Uncharacterized protein n=1 Tax=Mucor saturninus TaxID=64648 RepID=A0A8H7R8P7_9FUNG|nr:hypothetical protein INT47_004025 [Mucor saturninus]
MTFSLINNNNKNNKSNMNNKNDGQKNMKEEAYLNNTKEHCYAYAGSRLSKFLLQSNHSHKFQPYVKPVKKPMNALFGDIPTQSHDTFDYGAHILDDETVFSEFDWITTHTPTNHLPLSPPLSPSDSHESFMLESLDDYVLFP